MAQTSPGDPKGWRKPTPALVRNYSEARQHGVEVPARWDNPRRPDALALAARVALVVARMAGKRIGVDTATRMAEDADRRMLVHRRPTGLSLNRAHRRSGKRPNRKTALRRPFKRQPRNDQAAIETALRDLR